MATIQQQYDAALSKYLGMLAKPPADYSYLGNDTETWLEMCDAQARVVRHLKNALKLAPKEQSNGSTAARRK